MLFFQAFAMMLQLENEADKVDIIWFCDPSNPARRGIGITPDNYYSHLSALLPIAYINPSLGSFMLMDSPQVLESYINDTAHYYCAIEPTMKEFSAKYKSYRNYYRRILSFYTKTGYVPHLSCHKGILQWAHSFLSQKVFPKIPVAVQLRKASNSLRRNSRLDEWFQFFIYCKDKFDVKFIVIGNREEINPEFQSLENVIFSKDYGTTVEQDMALLQISLMYMATTSGPNIMAWFSNLPYVIYNYDSFYVNLPYGSDRLPWATPLQKLVREPETTESLIDQLSKTLDSIDMTEWRERINIWVVAGGAK